MEELINKTIQNINDKLEWAKRSSEKMKENWTDKDEMQHDFWGYLTAFHAAWFYYSKLINELNPNLSKKKRQGMPLTLINEWKSQALNEEERISWETLNKLRNQDAHDFPVKANYEIRLEELTDSDGTVFTDYDGTPFCADVDVFFVVYDGVEYELESITNAGIECMIKLMKHLPELKNNSCFSGA